MKKILALVLAFVMVFCIVSCGDTAETTTTEGTTDTTTVSSSESTTETTSQSASQTTTESSATAESTTLPAECRHTYEETILTAADYLKAGEKELKCSLCGDTKKEEIPAITSIKILAIGNSFSVDAMEYLGDILENAGFDDVVLGNLYIGGCSLDTHWNNIQNNSPAYTFYVYEYGAWVTRKTRALLPSLEYEDWDIITIQQVSQNSGMPETFNNLQNILDFVNEKKTNDDAKIYWHMTWAYQQNSNHSGFANYKNDQMTMYRAIIDGAQNTILNNDDITDIIPSGTTIQNLRTTYLGDHLTRDGYHMSYDVGRYAAALTWYAKLTGLSADKITYVPSSYASLISPHLDAIQKAVTAAVENPFAVTTIEAKQTETKVDTEALTEKDREILTKAGYDPDQYVALDLKMTLASYYNSSNDSNLVSKNNSTASNLPYFSASCIFEKKDIPSGSIIIVDQGYQYRPEGWKTLNAKNSSRPGNVNAQMIVVDDAWWGEYAYRAFNLSYVGSKTNMTEADSVHLRIYIPKA